MPLIINRCDLVETKTRKEFKFKKKKKKLIFRVSLFNYPFIDENKFGTEKKLFFFFFTLQTLILEIEARLKFVCREGKEETS